MMQSGRPTRFFSSRQEKTVAKSLGGRPTANSGATRFGGGDVTTENVLLECKTCTKEQKSFTIKKEWITKNREEAFAMGKRYSALAIDFGNPSEQFYVVDENIFKEWLNGIDKNTI